MLRALIPSLVLLSACSSEGEVLSRLPPREPWVPRAADGFVDSIGMTILNAGNERFAERELPALERLGVRHVRDWALVPEENAAQVAMLGRLATLGIRTHLIFEPRFDVTAQHLAPTADALGDALESVEGPNDNDANDIDLGADDVVGYLRALRAAIDEGDLTGRVALVDALDLEPEEKGDLSALLDYGNFERERDRALPGLDLNERKAAVREVCGGKPIMVTECGYSTTDAATSVSEAAQAKYVLRLLLGHFDQGIARTFVDELTDGPEDDSLPYMAQGLLHLDGSEKPAFGALERLIALLDVPGAMATLMPLDLSIDTEPAALRSVLLQRGDGRYALVLWQELESFDARRAVDREHPRLSVQLALASAARSIELHEPLTADSATQRERDVRTFVLHVPDHPVIALIEP